MSVARPAAATMWVATLIAAGDNRVDRDAARPEACHIDGFAHAFAGERTSVEQEPAAADCRTAEHILGGSETKRAATVAACGVQRALTPLYQTP